MLNLVNGMVSYVVDTTAEFEIGTLATHTCNADFALVGSLTRTCMDDDQADIIGVWSGNAPTCKRKHFNCLPHLVDCLEYSNISCVRNLFLQHSYPLFSLQQSSVHPSALQME